MADLPARHLLCRSKSAGAATAAAAYFSSSPTLATAAQPAAVSPLEGSDVWGNRCATLPLRKRSLRLGGGGLGGSGRGGPGLCSGGPEEAGFFSSRLSGGPQR